MMFNEVKYLADALKVMENCEVSKVRLTHRETGGKTLFFTRADFRTEIAILCYF